LCKNNLKSIFSMFSDLQSHHLVAHVLGDERMLTADWEWVDARPSFGRAVGDHWRTRALAPAAVAALDLEATFWEINKIYLVDLRFF
jgi:hypothetical protein